MAISWSVHLSLVVFDVLVLEVLVGESAAKLALAEDSIMAFKAFQGLRLPGQGILGLFKACMSAFSLLALVCTFAHS